VNAYNDFPFGVRLFWVSLTFLDPATTALIIFRRRSGIVLGIAVIVADIAVNWTVFVMVGGLSLFGVISQSLFAVVIRVTARPLWRWFGQSEGAQPAPAGEGPRVSKHTQVTPVRGTLGIVNLVRTLAEQASDERGELHLGDPAFSAVELPASPGLHQFDPAATSASAVALIPDCDAAGDGSPIQPPANVNCWRLKLSTADGHLHMRFHADLAH
jgi:hypothetical protein